jgi:hypothetical protein
MRCTKPAVLPIISTVLLFIFCSKPTDSKPVTADQVYGSWQSSQTDANQEKTDWTLTLDPNGTFTDHIVITQNSVVLEDVTNAGTWSLSNNTLTLVFEDETCIFRILAITATSMTLQDTYDSSQQVYTKL